MYDFRKYLPKKDGSFHAFLDDQKGCVRGPFSIEQLFEMTFEDDIEHEPILQLDIDKNVLFTSAVMIPASMADLIYANQFSDKNDRSCNALIHARIKRKFPRARQGIHVTLHSGEPNLYLEATLQQIEALYDNETYVLEVKTYKTPQARFYQWKIQQILYCTSSPYAPGSPSPWTGIEPSWFRFFPK